MARSLYTKTARRNMLIGALLATAIFWLAASQVTTKGMAGWERAAFDAVYNLPLSLKPAFLAVTLAGSVFVIALIGGLLLLTRHRTQAVRILLLSAGTYLVVWAAKLYFGRPRPNLLLNYITQRGPHEADYGFPSAHAAIAMAIGIGLLPIIPRKLWWLVFLAVLLVGLSRIYLGVHAPLDIIGGFALGAVTSLCYLLALSARRTVPSNTKSKKK